MFLVLGHNGFILNNFLKKYNKKYVPLDQYNGQKIDFGFFFAIPKSCSNNVEGRKMIDSLSKLTKFIDILNKNEAKLIFASSEGVFDYDIEDYIYLFAEEYIKKFCKKYLILRIPTVVGNKNLFEENGYEFDYITINSLCETLINIYENKNGIFNFKTKHFKIKWYKSRFHLIMGKLANLKI